MAACVILGFRDLVHHSEFLGARDALLAVNGHDYIPSTQTARARISNAWSSLTRPNNRPECYQNWERVIPTLSGCRRAGSLPRLSPRIYRRHPNRRAIALYHLRLAGFLTRLNPTRCILYEDRLMVDREAHEVTRSLEEAINSNLLRPGMAEPFGIEVDPYMLNWGKSPSLMPITLNRQTRVHVYTDGSTVPRDLEGLIRREDSGAAAVWFLQMGNAHFYLGSVRARVRHFPGNYLPELLGIALALRLTPQNLPLRVHYDCEAAHNTISKDGFSVSHRRRVSASARPVVEVGRFLLRSRECLFWNVVKWNKVRSHVGQSWGNEVADREAKLARNAYKGRGNRIWWWGAERVVLFRETSTGNRAYQVMGSQRTELERDYLRLRTGALQALDSVGRLPAMMGPHLFTFLRDMAKVQNSDWLRLVFLHLTGLTPTNYRLHPRWRVGFREELTECTKCASRSADVSTHVLECPADNKGLNDGSRPSVGAEHIIRELVANRTGFPMLAEDRCRLHMLDAALLALVLRRR